MEILKRLSEINKEIEPIKKEKTNQQQNFKYRGVDQVMNDLHNLFARHEVIITSEVINALREERTNKNGTVLIWSIIDYKFKMYAPDGTFIETMARGEAMDSGDKGSNKCISVALKYVMFNMFLIPTEEMKDPDAEAHELAAKKAAEAEQKEKLMVALVGVEQCETMEQLQTVWKSNPDLQKNAKFVKEVNDKKVKLTPKSE